jgi:hypothetical protein
VWLFAIIMLIPDPNGQSLLSISLTLVLAYVNVIALSALIRIGASYPNSHSYSLGELIRFPIGATIRLLILELIASLLAAPAMIYIYQLTIIVMIPAEKRVLPSLALLIAAIILTPFTVPYELAERHFVIADPSYRAAIRSGWSLTKKNIGIVFAGYGLAIVLRLLSYPLAGILVVLWTSFPNSSSASSPTLVVSAIFLTSVLLFPFANILGTHTYLKITSQKSVADASAPLVIPSNESPVPTIPQEPKGGPAKRTHRILGYVLGIGCLIPVMGIAAIGLLAFFGVFSGSAGDDDEAPAWSPDGRRIAFTSNRDGNPDIYTMNPDGSDVEQLTKNPFAMLWWLIMIDRSFDGAPDWSPDGERIVFFSGRNNPCMASVEQNIIIMDRNGANAINLTLGSGNSEYFPSWSPAGDRIAFHSYRGLEKYDTSDVK